jgi:hypothetical protein
VSTIVAAGVSACTRLIHHDPAGVNAYNSSV